MTAPGPIRPLTKRQQQVVEQLVLGRSYKEIAAALHMKRRTVETHVRQIANLIDGLDALPPRYRIYTWAMHARWEAEHQRKLAEAQRTA